MRSDKPAFLGEEDLPDPREFKAPFGYDPGSVEDFGCALIATIADYKDPKITNLSPGFIGEHHRFESLLTHDFKCRIMEESVVSLLNPTASEFVDGLERLRRMGRPTGFTFIYICSHVATVGGSGAYVCCRDTDWRNADSVKRTAVSLARLCTLINALPGARKAIALSIAHPSNPPKRFSSGLKLYPPKGFYCDLADKCGCAVLGSCNIGSTVRQHLMHTYPLPPKERESAVLRALRKSQKTAVRAGKGHAQEDPGSSSGEEESDEYEVEEDCRTVGPTGPIKYRRYRHHDMCPAVVLRQLELLKRRKEDRTKRDSVVIREPHPAWQRHEEHGFVVVTPHPREVLWIKICLLAKSESYCFVLKLTAPQVLLEEEVGTIRQWCAAAPRPVERFPAGGRVADARHAEAVFLC